VPTATGGGVEVGGGDGGAGFGDGEECVAGVETCFAGAGRGVSVTLVGATETDGASRGDRNVGRGAAWLRAAVIVGA
jgi:hypothetical protein